MVNSNGPFYVIISFILLIVVSCTNNEKSVENQSNHPKLPAKPNSQDSIFDFDNIVFQLKASKLFAEDSQFTLQSYLSKNNNHDYFIVDESNGNCINSYFCSTMNKVMYNILIIRSDCDSDPSYYKYKYLEYELDTNSFAINIMKVTHEVTDPTLIDKGGYLKNGISIDDDGLKSLKIDTIRFTVSIKDYEKISSKWPKIIKPEDIGNSR